MAGDGMERENELRQRGGALKPTTAGTTTNSSEANTPTTSKKSVYGRTPDGAS